MADELVEQLVLDDTQIIGECVGCNKSHAGSVALRLDVTDEGLCLMLGTESEHHFHVLHVISINKIPRPDGFQWRIV